MWLRSSIQSCQRATCFFHFSHWAHLGDSAVFWDFYSDHFFIGTWVRGKNSPPCPRKECIRGGWEWRQPVNLFLVHIGPIPISVHAVQHNWNAVLSHISTHLPKFYLFFKTHLIPSASWRLFHLSIHSFPGLLLYLQSVLEFNVNSDHALCFFSLPSCVPHSASP